MAAELDSEFCGTGVAQRQGEFSLWGPSERTLVLLLPPLLPVLSRVLAAAEPSLPRSLELAFTFILESFLGAVASGAGCPACK